MPNQTIDAIAGAERTIEAGLIVEEKEQGQDDVGKETELLGSTTCFKDGLGTDIVCIVAGSALSPLAMVSAAIQCKEGQVEAAPVTGCVVRGLDGWGGADGVAVGLTVSATSTRTALATRQVVAEGIEVVNQS